MIQYILQYTCIGNLAHVMSNIAVFLDMAQLLAFFGDSGGIGFNQYIQTKKPFPQNFEYYTYFQPGGALMALHNIQNMLSSPNTIAFTHMFITMFAGICNLTTKHGNRHGHPIHHNCHYCNLPYGSVTYISRKQQVMHELQFIKLSIESQ